MLRGALDTRVFNDADCEQLVTSRLWILEEPCLLEGDFDLDGLKKYLPNETYSTRYVYVKDIPRIDDCVHALFIVPESSSGSSTPVTVKNAHFLIEFDKESTGGYGDCPEINVTLFLGDVNL